MWELELEQRTNIKFLVKLGKSGNEIRAMLVQVYRDNAVKETAVYRWGKRCAEGRESGSGEERSGRSATSSTEQHIAQIRQITRENRRLIVRNIAEQANIDRETVTKILTEDLDMKHILELVMNATHTSVIMVSAPHIFNLMETHALIIR